LKELKTEIDNFEDYFRNTIIPQLFIDKNLILRKFSPAAMKQFNLSADSYNLPITDITNNLRYPSIIKNIKWVMATSKILEKEIQTTDMCWYQMNIIPYLKGKDNEPNGVIITFVDITNRIKDLKDQEKLIAEYETLLDTIAHDIKNRLTGMMLSIEMLKESDLEDKEELRLDLDSLDRGVNKINLIIGELFESRNQKYKYEAVDELLNIEHILEDVKLALTNEITKSNATITLDINCSEIIFPRRQLRSIIYNLVSNSIKYKSLDRNPEIVIKTVQEDDYIIISVKDNGTGIESGKQKNIFSKFYRIAETVEGSGVGLHLVKTLVTNAGGKIELESEFGAGSEFKIFLKTKCKDIYKSA
jgi:two-component system, OmpR family, phosphate regulon sensor histidine kinase PhoR